jgi:hypothetical protein
VGLAGELDALRGLGRLLHERDLALLEARLAQEPQGQGEEQVLFVDGGYLLT